MKKDYITVSNIALSKLNNGEFLSFIEQMRALLPIEEEEEEEESTGGAPALNITAEQIKELDDALTKLHDRDQESTTKKTTRSRKEIDKTRDALAVAIVDKVITSRNLPFPAERDAAETLYDMAKTYRGISSLPNKQETERIVGMLMDFAKPEYASAVSVLQLKDLLDELQTYNDTYRSMTAEDSAKNTLRRDADTSDDLRDALTTIYEVMRDYAFASNLLQGSDESVAFLKALNNLIAETKESYNKRMAGKKEKDDDQKPEEKPDEKPTDPDKNPTEPDEEGGGTHFEPVE